MNGLTGLEVAVIVFVVLNLLDWITTAYALKKPQFIEANPIARKIYEKYGSIGLLTYKQVFVGLIVFSQYLAMGLEAEEVIWSYNALFGLVVAWNSFMLSSRYKSLRDWIKKHFKKS